MTPDPLRNLRIAAPCPADWKAMIGDERVRHCSLCQLNVYNFAEMTAGEVRELLVRSEGRVCARLYQRADGTLITRDCPTGIRALRRRASRMATAVVMMLVSLPMFGRPFRRKKSPFQVTVEQAAAPQPAMFTGVVLDESKHPLPGVTVNVRDEASKRTFTTITDVDGAFSLAALHDGLYRVETELAGIRPAKIEHLQLKANEVTRATVTLRLDTVCTVTVGGLATTPIDTPGSTTFTQDFLDKLPL